MKLIRYGEPGAEKPGLIAPDGMRRCLAAIVPDLDGEHLSPDTLARIATLDHEALPVVDQNERWGPPVGGIGTFMCIGLNYADHAAETGAEVPAEPVLFMKSTSAVCGAFDDVVIPPGSQKSDWEVELGVIIGTRASYVSEEHALDHVAGYCVVNDLSERAYQLEGTGQWVKGKSCDTFGPIGPWLVTKDEVPDPQQLDLWLEVDGHRYQNGNTRTMVFGVAHLISYISRHMTLRPGDVISTGTPPGVGLGQNPQVYLKPGQEMRLGIDRVGEQRQRTVQGTGAASRHA